MEDVEVRGIYLQKELNVESRDAEPDSQKGGEKEVALFMHKNNKSRRGLLDACSMITL